MPESLLFKGICLSILKIQPLLNIQLFLHLTNQKSDTIEHIRDLMIAFTLLRN